MFGAKAADSVKTTTNVSLCHYGVIVKGQGQTYFKICFTDRNTNSSYILHECFVHPLRWKQTLKL